MALRMHGACTAPPAWTWYGCTHCVGPRRYRLRSTERLHAFWPDQARRPTLHIVELQSGEVARFKRIPVGRALVAAQGGVELHTAVGDAGLGVGEYGAPAPKPPRLDGLLGLRAGHFEGAQRHEGTQAGPVGCVAGDNTGDNARGRLLAAINEADVFAAEGVVSCHDLKPRHRGRNWAGHVVL